MDPCKPNCTYHRTIIHTLTTHLNMHIHNQNQKQMHIPSTAPPIRDPTPSGWSCNHSDHWGVAHTNPWWLHVPQTWTHVPEEAGMDICCGQTPIRTRPNTRQDSFLFLSHSNMYHFGSIEPFPSAPMAMLIFMIPVHIPRWPKSLSRHLRIKYRRQGHICAHTH